MRRLIAVLAGSAVLFLVLAPTTAAAGTPTIDRFAFHDTAVYQSLSDECGFTVWRSVDLRGSDTQFGDGTEMIQIHVENVVWANGPVLTDNDNFTISIRNGVQTMTGTIFNINVRGQGMILLDAGRIAFDATGVTFMGGPHESLAGRAAECAALAS
jgi:hypothetical protein